MSKSASSVAHSQIGYADLSNEQLLSRLHDLWDMTVDAVKEMADIVVELERRGREIDIKLSIIPWLRKIGYGQVAPELFLACQGNAMLLARASALAKPEQEQIIENRPFKVWQLGGDHRNIPPQQMTPKEVAQVFCNGRVRSESEQISWLTERWEKERACASARENQETHLDFKRRGLVVGSTFIALPELAHYVAELSAAKK